MGASIAIWNGTLLSVFGTLCMVASLFAVPSAPRILLLTFAFGGLAASGYAARRYGKNTNLEPDLSIPTYDELPADHPRKARPLWQRRLVSASALPVFVGGSALCIWASISLDLGEWPTFFGIFCAPFVLYLVVLNATTHFMGQRRWPTR